MLSSITRSYLALSGSAVIKYHMTRFQLMVPVPNQKHANFKEEEDKFIDQSKDYFQKLHIDETVSNHGNATDHITSRTLFPM